MLAFFLNHADDPAGVAGRNYVSGDVLGDDTAGADNRVLADRHPGQDAHPTTEPDVIAYVDGLGVHLVVRPFHRVFGVVGTVQPDLGADVNEVADRDLVAI